jgi:hypothetical protein
MGAQGVQGQAKGLHDGNGGGRDPAAALAHRNGYRGQTGQTINRSYTQTWPPVVTYYVEGRQNVPAKPYLLDRRVKCGFITV